MTQKQILALAADDELMSLLDEIYDIQYDIQSNFEFKTVNEQKVAKKEMEHLAKILIETLK